MSKNCTNDGCSCTPNMSIKCSVTSCAHHCQDISGFPPPWLPPWGSCRRSRLILILD